jgi:hypothetical protein
MKKGKFILGAASVFVTAIGAFAFKSHQKFNNLPLSGTSSAHPGVCLFTECFESINGAVVTCHEVFQGNITKITTL